MSRHDFFNLARILPRACRIGWGMNIYGSKHLANSFRTVRNNTIQVAEDIPEAQYSYVAAEGTRTVAQMLAHVGTMTSLWQEIHGDNAVSDMNQFDFLTTFNRLQMEESQPRTKAEIVSLLRSEGEKFAAFLESLSEAKLAEEVQGPPGCRLRLFGGDSAASHRAFWWLTSPQR